MTLPIITDELDVLGALLPTPGPRIIELGCGSARLARALLQRWPACSYLGLEVDRAQLALNQQSPPAGMVFAEGAAQAIDAGDAQFDLALMLKSLHHVPMDAMDTALEQIARVLRVGGHAYLSEPVYDGALNTITRCYNDERVVRAAAQAAIDRALAAPDSVWQERARRDFVMPVHFASFEDFEARMMHPSFADHHIDAELRARVAAAFAPYCNATGAAFERPMRVRLLERVG